MNAHEILSVHQLLGRIVYFHALFIEPALGEAAHLAGPGRPCCRHSGSALVPVDPGPALQDTAWAVLGEVAATLPTATCPGETPRCCPICQVRAAGKAIAECWIDVEHRAYGTSGQPRLRQHWSQTVAARLASSLSRQHGGVCTDGAVSLSSAVPPPSRDRFPLTRELWELWIDPTNRTPVTSWLNYCTRLTDIAQVLETARTSR